MEDELGRDKGQLRRAMRASRRALPAAERDRAALAASDEAQKLPALLSAKTVALYGALPDELDPAPLAFALAKRGKTLAYPRVEPDGDLSFREGAPGALAASAKNIPEPLASARAIAIHSIDAFVIPGLAFDSLGGRLGFGGGYYDRALRQARPDALRLGYAFERQIVLRVPKAPHDQPVDCVVTEARVLVAPPRPF